MVIIHQAPKLCLKDGLLFLDRDGIWSSSSVTKLTSQISRISRISRDKFYCAALAVKFRNYLRDVLPISAGCKLK